MFYGWNKFYECLCNVHQYGLLIVQVAVRKTRVNKQADVNSADAISHKNNK